MTSVRRSASGKSGARSNARRAGADTEQFLIRCTERFAAALRDAHVPQRGSFVVAASGGTDSAAALWLLRRTLPRARIIACYVDHGIRPKASIARDVQAVRRQCAITGATLRLESVIIGAPRVGSPEERARVARYAALVTVAREVGARYVVTGHQQDDIAETIMLALIRGTGLDGAAGMQSVRELASGIQLVRPLLWARKTDCDDIARAISLPVSFDETNRDTSIPRNAIRASLNQIESRLPGARRGIARSGSLLNDDKRLLQQVTAAAFKRAQSDHHDGSLSVAVLRRMPLALVRRVVRLALAQRGVSLRNIAFDHYNDIAKAIRERRGGTFHAGTARVVLSAGKLVVERGAGGHDGKTISVDVRSLPGEIKLSTGTARINIENSRKRRLHATPDTVMRLDLTTLSQCGDLVIRLPQTGDKCVPAGRSTPVSLARFLAKSGVPRPVRQRLPVLCAGGRIAAVLGVRVMAPFEPKETGPVLAVAWQPTDI